VVLPYTSYNIIKNDLSKIPFTDEAITINLLCSKIEEIGWFIVITDPESYAGDGVWKAMFVSYDISDLFEIDQLVSKNIESKYSLAI